MGNRHSAAKKPKRKQSAASLANLTGGSRKGIPNKTAKAVKEMVIEALNRKGGVKYLVEQADENPKAFLTLVGKCLPLDVNSSSTVEVTMKEARDAAAAAFLRTIKDESKAETLQ